MNVKSLKSMLIKIRSPNALNVMIKPDELFWTGNNEMNEEHVLGMCQFSLILSVFLVFNFLAFLF